MPDPNATENTNADPPQPQVIAPSAPAGPPETASSPTAEPLAASQTPDSPSVPLPSTTHRRSPLLMICAAIILLAVVGLAVAIALTHGFFKSDIKNTVARSSASTLQSIATPCYSVKIPKTMKLTQTPDSCTFQATDAAHGELYLVKVLNAPSLTTSTLAAGAQTDAKHVVDSTPGGVIKDQRSSTFAQNPAYAVTLTSGDGSTGALDYVYKTMAKGNLLIVMHTQKSGQDYSLSTIESNWSWH